MAQPTNRSVGEYKAIWVVEWTRDNYLGQPIVLSKVYLSKSSALSSARKLRAASYYKSVKVFQLDTKTPVKCIDLSMVKLLNNPQNKVGEVVY